MYQAAFNFGTTSLLSVSFFGFFLALLLFTNKKGRKTNLPIILLILGFSFILLQYLLLWTKLRLDFPYLYFFDHSWYLLFGPLLYNYISRYYINRFTTNWLHFTPPFISFLLNLIYLVRAEGFFKLKEFQGEILFSFFWSSRSPWLAALSMLIYLFLILDVISFHRETKETQYGLTLSKWINTLLILYSIFITAYISYFILSKFPFFSPTWDYTISFMMAIAIYSIGYMVYKEPSIFNGNLFAKLFLKKNTDSSFSDSIKEELFKKLIHHMQTEKPYRNHELRMVQLADQVGFSSHVLSKIINEKAQKNFNQFINDFRLEEAVGLLLADDSASIKSIYFSVGFNNKVTFYQLFKNKYNCTPSMYKTLNKR